MARRSQRYKRGLGFEEVALIKAMRAREYPRDLIMSYMVTPGRILSPAVMSEIENREPEKSIPAASDTELDNFMALRRSERSDDVAITFLDPLTPSRINEVLFDDSGQSSLPGFESVEIEYKEKIGADRESQEKFCKSFSALANTRGGYLFIGINDSREIVGIKTEEYQSGFWNTINSIISNTFTPQIEWKQKIIQIGANSIFAIHVREARRKPIVSTRDCGKFIKSGNIYYRYPGETRNISAPDLIALLAERDRLVELETLAKAHP